MSKQCLDVQQMQHLQELGLELKDTMLYWIKPLDAVIGIVVGLENDWQLDFIDDKKRNTLSISPPTPCRTCWMRCQSTTISRILDGRSCLFGHTIQKNGRLDMFTNLANMPMGVVYWAKS